MSEQAGESRLWKQAELVRSKNLPGLVESAAWQAGKPYTVEMLRAVAGTPELLDALDMTGGEGADAALATLAAAPDGATLDDMILGAVRAYEPKGSA